MIQDGRDSEVRLDGKTRVLVVGAGPAGLTLARHLARIGPVTVVESGGLEQTPHHLLAGETAGMSYPLAETRSKRFGGTSNLWAGYCAPLDDDDLLNRSWVPLSGWPISRDEVTRYANAAASELNLEEAQFDIAALTGAELTQPFADRDLMLSAWRFCVPNIDFGAKYMAEIVASRHISVLVNTQAVEIRLGADGTRVESLSLRTSNGRHGQLEADVVVIAGGGLESPRLLLASDRQMSTGIGSEHDMVGRCFMEHPHVVLASFVPQGRDWIDASTERCQDRVGRNYMLAIGLDPETRRAAGILNARAHAFRRVENGVDVVRLGVMCEQAPNPASRVTLADDTDAFGLRRLRLDWRLNEQDRRTHRLTAKILREKLVRLGLGKYEQATATNILEPAVGYCCHHMGTTRMSDDPENGVVDPDCRVWGVSNLYVAGSSVFPTGGWANPTFTIIALALRLADHLNSRFSAT